ncbi:MAG: metal-dependent hydrolase [Prolixibacteraceae bacterium]|jgi:inner membrane protein|nr:metal-dependent hydrolase [Prolixibacteraceae bacterium]
MKAGNHIAGGIVFTGLFASFFNANIFSSFDLLAFTAFASLIPDVDHTKSAIGKIFYPLAKFLDRRFGHRTITHSALFLAILCLFSAFIENLFSEHYQFTVILFFAVFSHLVLDMITVQGIPFFYPFAKNPCVIPENPRYRIRTSNNRAEVAVFCISILLMFSCANLFKNGFWTTYNRAFGTLKHVHAENMSNTKFIRVDYDYVKNNNRKIGSGYLLHSNENEIVIFDKKVTYLNKNDNSLKINYTKPFPTIYDKVSNEIGFFNISFDSLNAIINNKIVSGQIQSSEPVEFIERNIRKSTSLLKLNNSYNFQLNFFSDTSKISDLSKIRKIEIRLEQERKEYESKNNKLRKIENEINKTNARIKKESDLYQKNKLQNLLIDLKSKYQTEKNKIEKYTPDPLLTYDLKQLKNKTKISNEIRFSGVVTFPLLPEKQFAALK